MTKTFTEKGIEYLLVEVPEGAYDFRVSCITGCQLYLEHKNAITRNFTFHELGIEQHSIISLLKDITEEQAKEIVGGNPSDPLLSLSFIIPDCDSSLNWLLLKKI